MTLRVLEMAGVATVQDLGRYGYQRFGISPSGAQDWLAHRAANLLVGNPADAATVEIGLADQTYQLETEGLVAVTGAGFVVTVQGQPRPLWTALYMRAGQTLELHRTADGNWAYLAVAGGLLTAPVLGSRSTFVVGRLGGHQGRPLQAGDTMATGLAPRASLTLAASTVPPDLRPAYALHPRLEVIPGPQTDAFSEAGLTTFLSSRYTLSQMSDRMGYRLEGPAIEHRASADIISDALAIGSIQVPGSGQPLIMMNDRPTTGGYTKIATVTTADLPLLAQCRPGVSQLGFTATTVEAAQARHRQQCKALAASVHRPEPDWVY